MARLSVADIMKTVSGTVNQDVTSAAVPSAGSTEWQLWLEFINRSVYEWAEASDWDQLRKFYYPLGINGATVPMPADYKKVASAPKYYVVGEEKPRQYAEEIYEQKSIRDTSERYYIELGNQSDGYNLVFNPGTFVSGASLEIFYFSYPTSLASPAQILPISDAQFVIDRTTAFLFQARSDPRFQQLEANAREKLLSMVENENMRRYTSFSNQQYVQNGPLAKRGFRVGRD